MLDEVSALFSVSIYVESMLGLLLLFMWVQNFEIRAVGWWGSAHLLRAGSISLFGLYGQVADVITIDLANVILLTSCLPEASSGCSRANLRTFNSRLRCDRC
jgi:hypothetical protein